jgi:hypothetical protein
VSRLKRIPDPYWRGMKVVYFVKRQRHWCLLSAALLMLNFELQCRARQATEPCLCTRNKSANPQGGGVRTNSCLYGSRSCSSHFFARQCIGVCSAIYQCQCPAAEEACWTAVVWVQKAWVSWASVFVLVHQKDVLLVSELGRRSSRSWAQFYRTAAWITPKANLI